MSLEILYDTMQIFGGRSFFTDLPLERMMRDARLNMIGEGSNEVLRAFIGVVGMRDVGMKLKNVKEKLLSIWKIPQFVGSAWDLGKRYIIAPEIPIRSDSLRNEAATLGRGIRAFGWAVFKALARHREDVIERQLVLNRIAEAAMAIYTMTAVLLRLDLALHTHRLAPNELETGKYYCRLAEKRINAALYPLFESMDGQVESLSDAISGIRS